MTARLLEDDRIPMRLPATVEQDPDLKAIAFCFDGPARLRLGPFAYCPMLRPTFSQCSDELHRTTILRTRDALKFACDCPDLALVTRQAARFTVLTFPAEFTWLQMHIRTP